MKYILLKLLALTRITLFFYHPYKQVVEAVDESMMVRPYTSSI